MSKFKTLLFMVIGITIMSCKKTDEEKIVTLDEMKQIANQSIELNKIHNLSDDLILLQKLRINNILNNKVLRGSKCNLSRSC
jgi:hypothetical protein